MNEWYRKNAEKRKAATKANKAKLLAEVQRYKESKPCMDCDRYFPAVCMDFDHRDPNSKVANVSYLVARCATNKVWIEIDKCDLVCANCHRIRSYG